MDAAEYKHIVLGLIFLKYVSDVFEERHAKLMAEKDQWADPECAIASIWTPIRIMGGKCPR